MGSGLIFQENIHKTWKVDLFRLFSLCAGFSDFEISPHVYLVGEKMEVKVVWVMKSETCRDCRRPAQDIHYKISPLLSRHTCFNKLLIRPDTEWDCNVTQACAMNFLWCSSLMCGWILLEYFRLLWITTNNNFDLSINMIHYE